MWISPPPVQSNNPTLLTTSSKDFYATLFCPCLLPTYSWSQAFQNCTIRNRGIHLKSISLHNKSSWRSPHRICIEELFHWRTRKIWRKMKYRQIFLQGTYERGSKARKKFWSWGKKLRLRSKDKDINVLVWIVEHSHTLPNCASCARIWCADILPKLDLVFDLSIIALLLGLLRTDLFAREMSAVTLVIDILRRKIQDRRKNLSMQCYGIWTFYIQREVYPSDTIFSCLSTS